MKILINGMTNTTHSVALVNQFQLISLHKYLREHEIIFNDVSHEWPKYEPGFTVKDMEKIRSYKPLSQGDKFDVEYSIGVNTKQIASKSYGFFVTEFCKLNDDGAGIRKFLQEGGNIIVPSQWVRNRLTELIGEFKNIHVIAHGYNKEYFYPLDHILQKILRKNLNIGLEDHIFMNLGAITWNKGIDILLIAFSILRNKYDHIKLLIKDSSNLYKNTLGNIIQDLSNKNLISNNAISSIISYSGHLSLDKLNYLYNIADCYVSPYRAEGFNLPCIEAMATGCGVISTKHGASDDFIASNNNKVESKLVRNQMGTFLEPSTESLIERMSNSINNKKENRVIYEISEYEYNNIADKLLRTLSDHQH